ncbi:MAG: hypothetical protein H6Q50_306 [Deltaproteobacteria bacterium]|nr:hypothetical protein [Deltaproteobacteria bacterium]
MIERVYTIGHGMKPFEEFVRILKHYEIEIVADIRSFPASRRHAHFSGTYLERELPSFGMSYLWCRALGGFRKKGLGDRSPNIALKNLSFRNYADYMLSKSFQESVALLLKIVQKDRVCLLCAETLPFRCHRWILSDYLTAHGTEVVHLMDIRKCEVHKMSRWAAVREGWVIYDKTETSSPGAERID